MGQTGRYLDSRRALSPEVERTRIPPASMSREARTAAMATDSTIADWALNEGGHFLEVGDVSYSVFSLQACLVHLSDGFDGVVSLGSLTGQHDTVGAISDGVTDVADLGAGRARVGDHGFQHLSCTNYRLAGDVTHGNHLLLRSENLGGWDFDTEISTSYHDTIGLLENLGEVVEALTVLDLGNDLDMGSIFTKDLTDVS